mgnify:CR=1 FL=1
MKVGLVVGRFQPFHKGHLYLIEKALESADKIIIAVGSSNISNEDNPLSYNTRVKMLKKVIAQEGIAKRVIKIVASPDDPSDDAWLKELLENAGRFDIAFGNNDWTNDILEKAGYKVTGIRFLNRKIYQGVIIRKLFKKGKDWEERVPSYLAGFIRKELSKATLLS